MGATKAGLSGQRILGADLAGKTDATAGRAGERPSSPSHTLATTWNLPEGGLEGRRSGQRSDAPGEPAIFNASLGELQSVVPPLELINH